MENPMTRLVAVVSFALAVQLMSATDSLAQTYPLEPAYREHNPPRQPAIILFAGDST